MRRFAHTGKRNPLRDRDQILRVCRHPGRNHVYATFGDDRLRGLGVAGGVEFPISPLVALTTLALPCKCVIIWMLYACYFWWCFSISEQRFTDLLTFCEINPVSTYENFIIQKVHKWQNQFSNRRARNEHNNVKLNAKDCQWYSALNEKRRMLITADWDQE